MASTRTDTLTEEPDYTPTRIHSIGTSTYLVPSESTASIKVLHLTNGDIEEVFEQPPMPVTIINVNQCDSISSFWLDEKFRTMLAEDDVFCREFLSFVFLQFNLRETPPPLDDNLDIMLKSWGISAKQVRYMISSRVVPSGPYFLSGPEIHRVFKLCLDPCGAFVCGVVQSEDDPMRWAPFSYSQKYSGAG
jgi:hypothetical protein